ncbi:MAG: DMT family transporter [Clostridia bacterium]|nr:DMT family transporter [Clostridia bacterium]
MNVQNNKKALSYVLLVLTTLFWGAGFVFNNMAVEANAPTGFVNTVRFAVATLLVGLIFGKRIVTNKKTLLYGAIGGASLACAFCLQYFALGFTTPANNSFFTSIYIAFVPIFYWITAKKRPNWTMFVGVAVAIAGLAILNFGNTPDVAHKPKEWLGNLLTIGSAVFFAIQIVVTDKALSSNTVDTASLTFWQIAMTAVFSALYTAAFEVHTTNWAALDWKALAIALAYLAVLGTGFAYPSQIFAQKHLHPATCSLIMSLEGVVGAIASVIARIDHFSWYLLVGGLLVTLSIVIVEVLPYYLNKLRK